MLSNLNWYRLLDLVPHLPIHSFVVFWELFSVIGPSCVFATNEPRCTAKKSQFSSLNNECLAVTELCEAKAVPSSVHPSLIGQKIFSLFIPRLINIIIILHLSFLLNMYCNYPATAIPRDITFVVFSLSKHAYFGGKRSRSLGPTFLPFVWR